MPAARCLLPPAAKRPDALRGVALQPLGWWPGGALSHRTRRSRAAEGWRSVTASAGSGLESYQRALSRIEALWPSSKVLDVIEESIFRRSGTDGEQAFDLEAYRELLLLYAVARDIVEKEGGDLALVSYPSSDGDSRPPTRFAATALHPLSAQIAAAASAITVNDDTQDIPLPPPSMRVGLDIDLAAFSDAPAEASRAGDVEATEDGHRPVAASARAADDNSIDFVPSGLTEAEDDSPVSGAAAVTLDRDAAGLVVDEGALDRRPDDDESSLTLDDSLLDSEAPPDSKADLSDFELFDPEIEKELEPRTTSSGGPENKGPARG